MCNLYSMTSNAEAITRLFKVTANTTANLPLYDAIYPDREAPVVRPHSGGGRELTTMRWGFPPPSGVARPVTNVRNLASPFWRSALANAERRCLVPVTKFSEWTAEPDPATGRKRKIWFSLRDPDDVPFAFAGIWRPADEAPRMAFLTCEPNGTVGAVHPKAMPVLLKRQDYDRWLTADYGEAVRLAQPYPDGDMVVLND